MRFLFCICRIPLKKCNFKFFPGHDYKGRLSSTVGHERESNSRLGHGRSKQDFVEIMKNLDLPYPKKIDIALPANKACGK